MANKKLTLHLRVEVFLKNKPKRNESQTILKKKAIVTYIQVYTHNIINLQCTIYSIQTSPDLYDQLDSLRH